MLLNQTIEISPATTLSSDQPRYMQASRKGRDVYAFESNSNVRTRKASMDAFQRGDKHFLCEVIPQKAASKDVITDANSWSGKSGRATKLRRLLASSYTLECSRLIVATKSDKSACDKGWIARFSDNLERACRAAGLVKTLDAGDLEGILATHVSSSTKWPSTRGATMNNLDGWLSPLVFRID